MSSACSTSATVALPAAGLQTATRPAQRQRRGATVTARARATAGRSLGLSLHRVSSRAKWTPSSIYRAPGGEADPLGGKPRLLPKPGLNQPNPA
jgi:hypothetical protein